MTHSTARVLFLTTISAFVTWGRSLPPSTVPLLDRQNAIPIMRTSFVPPYLPPLSPKLPPIPSPSPSPSPVSVPLPPIQPPITEDGGLSRIS